MVSLFFTRSAGRSRGDRKQPTLGISTTCEVASGLKKKDLVVLGTLIAVDNGEVWAQDAFLNADRMIAGAVNVVKLLLIRNSCKATLRP